MTKNELKALIDKKVQRQGTQGAISLAPILNEIIDLIPESTGVGSGVPVVEIELPNIYNIENIEDVIYPRGIDFEIPAEKAAILDKNPCAIIASKETGFDYDYLLPLTSNEWYRMLYDASNDSAVASNILTLRRHGKDMRMSILLKAIDVVRFVSNEESSNPLTRYLVPTIKAVYDEINKTK